MPSALRKIDHGILWDAPSEGEKGWLGEEDLRADALKDILTAENRLSIYLLEDGSEVTVERIVSAIGAKRNNVAKFDYVIFDLALLEELNIEADSTVGATPDKAVNGVHRDLVRLTANKLAGLGALMRCRGKVDRVVDKVVGRLINHGLQSGNLDSSQMPGDLLEKLKQQKYSAK